MAVKVCQYCHGTKVVQVEVKPGKWVTKTCPACHGRGVIDTSTI